MSSYLRDKRTKFLTIGEDQLKEINDELDGIMSSANPEGQLSATYVLRYDGMGIVRSDFSEIARAFKRASKVERIALSLRAPQNAMYKGKNVEITLDIQNPDNCSLVVTDDDEAWVDSNFGRLSAVLKKLENGNWFAHSIPADLLIQLAGVLFGFCVCLIGANLLAPMLSIKHSFFVLFVGVFLIFSNLWTYFLVLIGRGRAHLWPLISFKKEPLGIVGQSVAGTVIGLLPTGLLNLSWSILRDVGTLATK